MNKVKNAIHPLILVSKTPLHDQSRLTECRKIDSIPVIACAEGYPDLHFTYNFYTHDFILPN